MSYFLPKMGPCPDCGDLGFPYACENAFEAMLQDNPKRLLEWVESGTLEPHDLTFAAETLGKYDSKHVMRALWQLLEHPDAAVREGAVYGLRYHPCIDGVIVLQEALTRETSPAVRSVMGELLDVYREVLAP